MTSFSFKPDFAAGPPGVTVSTNTPALKPIARSVSGFWSRLQRMPI